MLHRTMTSLLALLSAISCAGVQGTTRPTTAESVVAPRPSPPAPVGPPLPGACPLLQANPSDLTLLRSHDQRHFDASRAVLAAAERVFGAAPITGCTMEEVERLLGAPYERRRQGERELVTVMFHDGEQGRARRLTVEGGRVLRVDELRTQ